MNIRLVIDKLVLEGVPLSRAERVALEEALHVSLMQALSEKAQTSVLPNGRRSRNERLQLSISGPAAGAELGESLGTSLGNHLWDGQASQYDGPRGKQ